ncbi:MAG: hypothetical protein ACI8Y7_000687 [Candidatus Woesearchaeota archaeon]|jgi:hypothetical protein
MQEETLNIIEQRLIHIQSMVEMEHWAQEIGPEMWT